MAGEMPLVIGFVGIMLVSCCFSATQSSLAGFIYYSRKHPDFFRSDETEEDA
jgi:hypothetical protein